MKPLVLLLSFLRLDVETGAVTAKQWDNKPIPVGSLAKPFVALAYAQSHGFQYPHVVCKQCWQPRGHGNIGIVDALAQSCNTYFDQLRSELPAGALNAVAARFGLNSVDEAAPEQILRAYVELWRRAKEPGVAAILEGLRASADRGTSKNLRLDAFAKTGTASCTHTPKAPGDGFAVVLYPAVQPRVAVLVRLHSRPGAYAAAEARKLVQ